MRRIFVSGLLGLTLLAMTAKAEKTFNSGPAQVALIELFTSEGCSSCPPAEKWLGQFRERPELWRDIVPVAWHVNYWDRLGWKDIFASKKNTSRQYAYAKEWRTRSVYTPGFVLNGREWRRGDGIGTTSPDAGRLTIVWDDSKTAQINYTPPAGESRHAYTVTVAILGGSIISEVRAGENSGRDLEHEFVVLGSSSSVLKTGPESSHSATVTFSMETLPSTPRQAIAAWVTRREELTPRQATGGWLN